MEKQFWRDPVWSNVIAGVIVAMLLWVMHRENWWLPVWHGMTTAWAYLLGTITVRRWIFGLLTVGTVLFAALVTMLTIIARKGANQNEDAPAWLSYTSDFFFGLKWVWGYENRRVVIRAVLCPHCDYQLTPDSSSVFVSRVFFHCDSCHRTTPVEGQSWPSLQSVVERLIQQKLRREYTHIL